MLVMPYERAPVQIQHRSQVPDMSRLSASHVEEDLEVVREKKPRDLVGEGHVCAQESDARGPDILEGYEGGMDDFLGSSGGRAARGGGGERQRGRGGRAGTTLECTCFFVLTLSFP